MKRHEHKVGNNNGDYTNRQQVQRRTSKGRENVRHGRVYDEEEQMAIRAVTPESGASANFDLTALPSPISFPSHVQTWDPSPSVSNTDEEGTIENRWQQKPKRKITKHREHVPSDASPNSFLGKTRKRLGSITTASAFAHKPEDQVSSIGFPSVVQASVFPNLGEVKQPVPTTLKRTVSSDNGPASSTTSLRSPVLLDTDSNRILQLMKTTCGRMHGILFYRQNGTGSWNSGYCAINVAPGSLVCQAKGDVMTAKVLIPDLRGCTVRSRFDVLTNSTYLSVTLPASGFGIELRPPVPETFDSWLAALLCWQPLRPKGIHNKMTKPQSTLMSDKKQVDRRTSNAKAPRNAAIVKVGQMILWNGPLPAGSHRMQSKPRTSSHSNEGDLWQRVSCTLHENGTFKLLCEESARLLRTIRLSQFARCSVQRLDESVLDAEYCLAVFPQYTISSYEPVHSSPLVLRLESKVAYEAWFVLLRALTVPELYGPESDANSAVPEEVAFSEQPGEMKDMFRIERALSLKITEAKFTSQSSDAVARQTQQGRGNAVQADKRDADMYADVMLGRDLRARTKMKSCAKSVFWAEEFYLEDIPSILSTISVDVKVGNPGEREWTMITKDGYDLPAGDGGPELEGIEIASHDPVCGRVEILIADLEQEKTIERWWPLMDNNGRSVGQILMKVGMNENVVLMESEYRELTDLLHKFENGLTTQIAQVLGTDLKQLSDLLLDIFQASETVEEWINNLIEEEIDGIYKETPPVRMRFSGRIQSNDSYETAEQREVLVRDLSRSATMEANLLFRGNSLVTKALDAHMRRLGKEYLESTLGDRLRSIVNQDPNCEVDPARIKSNEQLERNWTNLINVTSSIWKAIATSASKCPPGMRLILKHIRSCAEDRYGSFIRTVKYTSVSGFFFLRFFCPAILNPKLFGLIDDLPAERPRRTFTLIAKSLIVLANMSKFGQKEPWMEPMNKFLTSATTEFKSFIEEVCSYTTSQPASLLEPQYQAPRQVKARLPRLSREGLPSLPFLLDSAKLQANLVEMWLERAPRNITDMETDACIQSFHALCLQIRQRARDCMSKAERAGEPHGNLEQQWQQLLTEQHGGQLSAPMRPEQIEDLATGVDNLYIPSPSGQRTKKRASYGFEVANHREAFSNGPGSPASPSTRDYRRMASETPRHSAVRPMTDSTSSSTYSVDHVEETRVRPHRSSRDGSSSKKRVSITKSGRKAKNGQSEPTYRDYDDSDL